MAYIVRRISPSQFSGRGRRQDASRAAEGQALQKAALAVRRVRPLYARRHHENTPEQNLGESKKSCELIKTCADQSLPERPQITKFPENHDNSPCDSTLKTGARPTSDYTNQPY